MPLRRILCALATIASVSTSISAASHAGCVVLEWTAPGDDSLSGRAARYDLRWSAAPLTPATFAGAVAVPELPAPGVPGARESVQVDGLAAGETFYFAITTQDASGNWSLMSNVVARVARDCGPAAGPACSFSAPRPNPARDGAVFALALSAPGEARVEVFDVSGRRVRALAAGPRPAGATTVAFDLRGDDGAPLAPGMYVVRARLGGTVFTRRLVVAR